MRNDLPYVMRLDEVFSQLGYDTIDERNSKQWRRESPAPCEYCRKPSRGLEFFDCKTLSYPVAPETLSIRPVCADSECEDRAPGYIVWYDELAPREKLLSMQLHLRGKRWYDAIFDEDLEGLSRHAVNASADAARRAHVGKPPRIKDKSSRYISKRLRAFILERDEFRCRRCGHTSANGAWLHIDHIVPVAKGGKTEETNLQSLCSDCNAGKSDRDPHPHDLRS